MAINKPRFLIGRGEKWLHHVTLHLKIPRWRIPSRAESVGGARAAVSAPGPSPHGFPASPAAIQVSTRRPAASIPRRAAPRRPRLAAPRPL